MTNQVPDHPDIRAAERTGYPLDYRSGKIIGRCECCQHSIYEGQEHYSSLDGRFCSEECYLEYYDIKEEDGYDEYSDYDAGLNR